MLSMNNATMPIVPASIRITLKSIASKILLAGNIPETTKIIIAQRVSSVQDADLIVVMDNGKISACGTHEELLKSSDIYREVYEQQVNGGDSDEE